MASFDDSIDRFLEATLDVWMDGKQDEYEMKCVRGRVEAAKYENPYIPQHSFVL